MRSKYGNRKITRDGMTFDSLKEYRRFCDLRLLEKAGAIQDLKRQVEYVLVPTLREPDTIGKRGGAIKGKVVERKVSYIADFVYRENDEIVVEDTKGFKTKEYIIKRKLMLWLHNIKIREV